MSAPISNSSTQTNNPTPTDQTGPASAVQTSVASTSSQGTITPTPTEADTINTTPLIWAFGLLVVVSLGVIWVVSQPWRLWQLKEWTIATGIGLPVGIVLVVLLTQGFGASATVTAAFVAATVAVATLILSAVNNMWGFNRARRIDTLKAWHDWDKDWGAAPAKVAEVFGSNVLDLQTVELMSQIRTAKLRGHLVVDETMVKAVSTLTSYLNGLERIASGIAVGAYDEALIRRLGATRLRMVRDRFGLYIEYRQKHASDASAKAYVNLDQLLDRVEKEKGAKELNPDQKRLRAAG